MAKVGSLFAEYAYVLLRLVVGLSFAQHGVQKLFGLLGGKPVPIASLSGVAGVIELVAGVLVALGIFPRWAAFIASGEMAVAYFLRHSARGVFPIQNGGELAVLYCFVFLYIAARGGGRWSLTRD